MRIGIVDDRVLAAEAIRRALARVPDYRVAWVARDGEDAVRHCATDRPDLVLMDLVMPNVNGVEATRRIMKDTPCPIVVVTSSVNSNYGLVYDALEAGAVDAVNTPTVGPDGAMKGADVLLAKVAHVARKAKGATPGPMTPVRPSTPSGPLLVAIGASTGGPTAVAEVLAELSGAPVAIVIVQHITPDFTDGLAEWVQQQSKFPVRVAKPGDRPQVGVAFLAGQNDHLILRADQTFEYTPHPTDTPFRPSVDALFSSLASQWPVHGVGVLLTGMWRDGADGLLKLRRAGWMTYAQDEATSAVFGMPDAAVKLGAAVHVLPPHQIGRMILAQASARQSITTPRT